MNEQRLWAPWRLGYIKGQSDEPPLPEPANWRPGAQHDCFLCRAAADYDDPKSAYQRLLTPRRGNSTIVVLNRYPYSNGHLLVSPQRHVADLCDLTDQEHLELMQTLSDLRRVLEQKLNAHGFNVGLNLGQVAGAGVPGHLHWHLVPRWPGDHNFMAVTAGARVIPQSLDELWQLLKDC